MARGLADALALFVLPFVLYGLALLVRQRFRVLGPQWTNRRLAWLTVTGLSLVVAGLLMYGLGVPRHTGPYVPAHLEGGRLVPGQLQ